jgi:hypothetical protein
LWNTRSPYLDPISRWGCQLLHPKEVVYLEIHTNTYDTGKLEEIHTNTYVTGKLEEIHTKTYVTGKLEEESEDSKELIIMAKRKRTKGQTKHHTKKF